MNSILAEPIVALGRTYQGIPFGGRGGQLTDIFFLICSVTDGEHLRLLARLSRILADAAFLAGLRDLEVPAEIHECIADAERKLDD